jgi:hypothetical protein
MDLNMFKRKSIPMALLRLVLILTALCMVSWLIAEFMVRFCSRTSSDIVSKFYVLR